MEIYTKSLDQSNTLKFQEKFIKNSNKLKILEKLIVELIKNNYKTLIFSQFKLMLDVIECLFNFKGWSFKRLDGNTDVIQK